MEVDTPDITLPKIDDLSCRACLRSGGIGIMHSFSDTADCSDGEKELRELYKKLTQIEVHLTDSKKPTLLCGSCTNKLINAYEFIVDAQKAENILSIHFKETPNEQTADQDQNEFDIEIVATEKPALETYKVEFINAETITADLGAGTEDFQNYESIDAVVNEVELENCEILEEVHNDPSFADQNEETIDGKSFSDIELLDDDEVEEISSDVADHKTSRKMGTIGSRLSSGPRHQINCDECQRGFAKLETYQRHKELAHTFAPREEIFAKQTNEQNILCPFCPRTFVHKNDLARHVNAIHPTDAAKHPIEAEPKAQKRQYKKATCPHCQKDFPQASIKIHIRRHLGINPYKCDTCDKAFPRKQDLTVHIRQHTGEKPHVCSVCAKSFIRPNKLSRHMRIHLGIRPYNCDECGKSFSQGPLTKAQQNKKYIEKLKTTDKYEEFLMKKAAAMRRYRAKQKAKLNNLPESKQNDILENKRKAGRERVRRHREMSKIQSYFQKNLAVTDDSTATSSCYQNSLAATDDSTAAQSLDNNTATSILIKEEFFD